MSFNDFNDDIHSNNKTDFFLDDILYTPKIKSKNSTISEFSFKPISNQLNSNEFNKENINITNFSEYSTDLTEIKNNNLKLNDKNILCSGNFVSNKKINYKVNVNPFDDDYKSNDNYVKDFNENLSENNVNSFSDFCIGININMNNYFDHLYNMDVEFEEKKYNNNINIDFDLFQNLFENNKEKKFLSMKRYNKDILTEGINDFSIKKKEKSKKYYSNCSTMK